MAGNISQNTITVGTSSLQIQNPSEHRKSMVFSAPVGGRVSIGPNNPAVDGQGIVLQQGDPPLVLCEYLNG